MLVSDDRNGIELAPKFGGLNPCFSGCWSRTSRTPGPWLFLPTVLILVLVDVGLGPLQVIPSAIDPSLNPCFSGCWSRTPHQRLRH